MGRLENKIAIITGATSVGIGRETALRFAREGASLTVTGRNEKAGKETVDMVIKEGGKCLYIQHDVSSEDNWINVVDKTIDVYGSLDILVNNAGQFWVKSIADWNEALFRENE